MPSVGKVLRRVNLVKGVPGLLSINLVGSYVYKKKFETISDLDFVIIVEELSAEAYRSIVREFQAIGKELQTPTVRFAIETGIGPLKPRKRKGKKVIQFHLLVYSRENFKKKDQRCSLISWIYASKTILGKPLTHFTRIRRLRKKDIVPDLDRAIMGFSETMIDIKRYSIQRGKMKSTRRNESVSHNGHRDVIFSYVIHSFLNYVRYSDPTIAKRESILLNHGRRRLGKEHYRTLRNAFTLKKRMRVGEHISKKEVLEFERKGKEFIKHLKRKL